MSIKVLPKNIAEKIAAGEVVERPSSVVKELVENSIDAGATKIDIEIKDGGISYIRVSDNGCGMNKENAKTAFLRHATSKITSEEDLDNISTMGFRGEALYAISAISEVELRTKEKAADKGVLLEVKGGIEGEVIEAATSDGTSIVVRNLFYNTPARMKFLKKNGTEGGYIEDLLKRLALANPRIAFKFTSDGKQKWSTNGNGDLIQVIYAVYGSDMARNCKKIDYEFEDVKVTGLLGNRETHRSNRNFQTVFVNGRYVKSPIVSSAVEEAHKSHIMVRKYPFFVLDIEVPNSEVDVNVHPAKTQVKFSNEGKIYKAVFWAAKNAIEDNNVDAPHAQEILNQVQDSRIRSMDTSKYVNPLSLTSNFNKSKGLAQNAMPMATQEEFVIHNDSVSQAMEACPECSGGYRVEPEDSQIGSMDVSNYRIIGQIFGTYIIIEKDDKMIMMDQHAAHERKIYEKLCDEEKVSCQPLLEGAQIVLSNVEMEIAIQNIEAFSELGFEIDQLNDNTIVVRTTPIQIMDGELKNVVVEIIGKLGSGAQEMTPDVRLDNLHTIACKAAIKGNNRLSDWEMREVVDWVLTQSENQTCPHGRPLIVNFTKYEIEKMFKRVV